MQSSGGSARCTDQRTTPGAKISPHHRAHRPRQEGECHFSTGLQVFHRLHLTGTVQCGAQLVMGGRAHKAVAKILRAEHAHMNRASDRLGEACSIHGSRFINFAAQTATQVDWSDNPPSPLRA